MRAARYLHVAPWDLAAQPVTWQRWALAAERAELGAEATLRKRAEERQTRGW